MQFYFRMINSCDIIIHEVHNKKSLMDNETSLYDISLNEEYILDRIDIRVIFIMFYTIVFCFSVFSVSDHFNLDHLDYHLNLKILWSVQWWNWFVSIVSNVFFLNFWQNKKREYRCKSIKTVLQLKFQFIFIINIRVHETSLLK